ncbi:hypothetical protein BGZ46_008637 [Entomortierella lignicola]|nr:hypothetical protein BGZ46_008637 [Entomortierella lignicola]
MAISGNARIFLDCFNTLNQDTSWKFKDIDIVERFQENKKKDCRGFSFARDNIADLSPGSSFGNHLPSQIKPVIHFPEIEEINLYEIWPTLHDVFERVFRTDSFDEVASAVKKEDLTDPVAFYLISIIFEFHSEIPSDINEREGFITCTWSFIRSALTMAQVESRPLEVLVTGVEERKNIGRDLRFETKSGGPYADGVGYYGTNQIYLAEASVLYDAKSDKKLDDEFKLVRAMKDSWASQVRTICRESIPPRGITVFGSSSFEEETKLWMIDFKGMYRLFQIDSFLIPKRKQDFGGRMKSAALSCMELAARIKLEFQKRKGVKFSEPYIMRKLDYEVELRIMTKS